MKIMLRSLIIAGIIMFGPVCSATAQNKQAVGWVERVCIYPGGLVFRAKLDTGAKNSSLNASHITEFKRDGEQWVRFEVTDLHDNTVTIERKVHRVAKIKNNHGRPQERLAVLLGICLGNSYREAEVNLVDRSSFNYQILIGRSFMRGNVMVDPSKKYTTKPTCSGMPSQ